MAHAAYSALTGQAIYVAWTPSLGLASSVTWSRHQASSAHYIQCESSVQGVLHVVGGIDLRM